MAGELEDSFWLDTPFMKSILGLESCPLPSFHTCHLRSLNSATHGHRMSLTFHLSSCGLALAVAVPNDPHLSPGNEAMESSRKSELPPMSLPESPKEVFKRGPAPSRTLNENQLSA